MAQLSGFAQSTGYLISIPGPLLVGVLYQHSGGWGLPIMLLFVSLGIALFAAWFAAAPRYVDADLAGSPRCAAVRRP